MKAVGPFAAAFCIIASMYGGAFSTLPAYLADIFGTRYVGAIHGRLLTAWSTAGILGPVIVNYLHDTRLAAGVPRDRIYGEIFYVLAALLALGFLCNALIRPVQAKWHMTVDAGKTLGGHAKGFGLGGGNGVRRGGLDTKSALAWAAVGIPLTLGILKTLENAAKIFL
jgi:hypothetical protein